MKSKNFVFILTLFIILLCCLGAISASEDVDNSISLSDDNVIDEVSGGVDSNDGSLSIQDNEKITASGGSNNESLEVQEVKQVDDQVSGQLSDDIISASSGNEVIEEPISENIVTQDNFYSFFDNSGTLLDTVDFDELIFKGNFSDLAAGYVIITKPMVITGDNAVLNNMGVYVSSDDVTLNDLTFNADTALGDLVFVESSNVNLNNLDITYIVGDESARALSLIGASDVTVNNARIIFESHLTDSANDGCAINIEDSDNVIVDGSEIFSSLPALYVDYMAATTQFMGLDKVNPIRIVGSNKVNITKNLINSQTNDYSQEFATIQAIAVLETIDCLIDSNEIYLTDEFAQAGQDIYLYGISFAYDEGLVMSNNNFTVYTEGGKEAAGTAYAIQGIESELSITGNNITTFSNGPNLGIYVTSMAGETSVMIIENNMINVTGLAAEGNNWALVSGIEIQNGEAKIYNNTVYTYNVDEYCENDFLSGISYIQWMYGGRTFDIQDNFVYTEGKYAIYLLDASNSVITGNTLYGHDLIGNGAVYIQSGENNIIKDNLPKLMSIVTQDNFYSFFDEDGVLLDTVTADELIFQGSFSDLAAGYVIINKPITITGDNAVFNDMGFVIVSEDVALDNLTLIATTSLGDLINVGASNVDLTNLDISYIVDDGGANAINVQGTDTIFNVNILNNKIYFESHATSDEDLVTAINLNDVEDVFVDGNKITASMPSLYVETYDYTYFMMGLCYVNPIRLWEAYSTELTNNDIDVIVNSYEASYPTVQALYIVGSEDVLVKGNNFTMVDTLTPAGTAIYLYAVECGFSSGIEFIENNFNISTTGGKSGAGSAYALQVATSDANFIGNNITCDSNGPNLGIFSPYGFGPAKDLVIRDNFLNISGYATGSSDYALISGIEVQTGYATIYNNTIYVQNKATYGEKYPVSGISAIQYSASTLTFDIQDNEIYTNGKYTVEMLYAPQSAIVTGNFLVSYNLVGDKSVYFKSGNNNIVENNAPTNVVTNDTFYDFFDDDGFLKTDLFKELVFNGTFSGLTDKIVLNMPISVIGIDAVLNDIAIYIVSDNVKLNDLTLNSNKEFADNNGALIYATGANIEIDDVVVNYTAPNDVEAIGIYANAANNFKLINSEIIYVATNPGSKHNYGLEVRDSENVLIENNKIDATLPAVDVDYYSGATGIDMDLVLAVGIQGGKNINFTENTMNVNTNGGVGGSPTIDAIQINSAENVLVNLNTISLIDLTTSDTARYYYCIDIYSSTATVDSNNVLVNTTTGIERSGTAYPIQLTGPFTIVISNNNLTSISKGPNLGIFASNWAGYGDLTIEGNSIDITGYAAEHNFALVSGIESQVDMTRIYDNVIKTHNIADYSDANQIYGVSIAQYYGGDHAADIRGNNISTEGKYAVYYAHAINTNVTLNELLAHELEGDAAAFIKSGDNNYIDVNFPPYIPNIIIEANNTWIGNDVTVYVTIANTTGNVTIKVNDKEFKDLVLVDGKVSQIVDVSDLVADINDIVVTFTSTDGSMRSGNETGAFYVLNGVVTQDSYLYYFNQEDNGKLFDYVPEGATLDFQGSIINPDQAIIVQMNVNKPVNIVSTTGDAYVDLNTTAGSLLGESPGNSFAVTLGGSGSNVTGIYFHNTQIWISNTHNVVLDGISVVVEDQRVGSGVGATSIRDNSSYVVLKNSYLYTRNNGGSTTFTMSWATYCTIDNCTVKAEGNVGNLVYLNVYNIVGAPSGVPLNNYNTISNNRIYGKEGSSISVGLMVEGTHNLIINNTLYKSSISTSMGGKNPADNVYVGNVLTQGGGLTAQANSIVYNNNVSGALSTGAGSVVYNNTVGGKLTVAANAKAYNNTVGGGLTTGGTDAVIENNTIVGAVTINKVRTTFIGNNVTGTVTVSVNNNVIEENNITSTGDYAVDLGAKTGNTVTDNYLVASFYKGDAAVKYSNADNVVEDNLPVASIEIVADNVWIGNNATVTVNVIGTTGTVTITVNNKSKTVDIVNGVATAEFASDDLVVGENVVVATYNGPEYAPQTVNDVFNVLNGVVTQDSYLYYFNQEDNGKLFDYVPEGATLDFQGSIINPDQAIIVQMNVNKPVNIVSTTGDAYVDLNTTAGSLLGESPGNSFAVTNGGSGSNITGIYLHNTQLWIANTHNVVLDNISVVVEDQRVGSGVGATSIRENSSYVVLKNSYLYTRNNGGSSTFTMSWTDHCTIDNCTLKVEGNVGNVLYLNIFNVPGAPSGVPLNNYNIVSNNRIYGKEGSGISVGLMVEGQYNLIVNNTLYKSSISTAFGGTNPYNNTYVGNVMTEGGSLTAQKGSIVYNNNVTGTLTTGAESVAYNNIVGKSMTVGADAVVYDNVVATTMSISGARAIVENNTIGGAVTISQANVNFNNNIVSGTLTVNSNDNVIMQNTITSTGTYAVDLKTKSNNVVTDNVLYGSTLYGDNAVNYNAANNNTVKDNHPPFDLDVVIEVGNNWYGADNIAYVTVTNSTGALGTGSVTFKINGKSYTVDLVDGKANYTLPGEVIIAGENELVVDYVSDSYLYNDNSNSTTFVVLDGVVTNATYKYYFDASGNLVSIVPDGATLDFQGLFLGKYPVYINKAVNVISSTEDALFDCGDSYAGNTINSFNMIAGADHSNITGLNFINYCLYIKGASYITVDNVSIVANKRGVGSGTGFLSIHTGAYYTTVKNGYFENGGTGSSLLVLGKGGAYVVFDHNIFNITGSSGNVLSANQFVGTGDNPEHTTYTNNLIYSNQPGSAFCYAMTVSGSGNLVENNTLYFQGSGILNQYGASSVGNVYRNNTIYGTATFSPSANSLVENNKVYSTGSVTISAGTTVINNEFKSVTVSGANVNFTENTVDGTLTVNSNNNVIKENSITSTGTYAIDLKTKTGNTVEENELIASSLIGDKAVNGNVNNNIIKNNYPNENGLSVSVEDIKVGETAVVNVSIYYSATGTVKVIIDGKVYDVPIDNGAAILELTDLKANDYDVRVIYDGDKYVTAGENFTSFTVSKYKSDAIITTSDIAVRTDVDVNVAIANATGDVTVIVDGNTLVLPLNDGVATFTIPSITAGEHTIRVSYLGDDKVEMVSNSTTFTVDRMPTSINVSSAEIYVGQTAEVTISFSEKIDADVLVEIDGKKTYVQLTNGTATLSYGTLAAGTYDISVTFAADDYFDSSSATGQIIVNKMDAGLNADASDVDAGSDAIINVEIDAWAIGDVNIIIDGQSIPVTFTKGKASVHIPGLTEGNYTALVKFEGDDRFNADETNVTFKVSKVKIDDINVDASVVKGTTDTQFKITLPSDATGTVTVTIGDKSVDDTLTNGKVAIAINDVTPGSYNVTVSYTGDDKYTAAEKTVPMTVDKLDAGLKATTDDIYVGEDAIISITINRAVTGNVNVYLGNLIVPVTINNGRGSATISGLSNGTYTATVRFANDDKFGDDEKEVTFTVYKYDLDSLNVVVDVPQETLDPEFSVTLPSDATGTITVIIDGKNATGTLTNGEVTVTVSDVTPGFYDDAIVSYSGDNKYEALQETVLVIVNKLDAGLEASADDIKVGENATISIEINEDVTGDVRIEFGNEVIPVTIVDGEASVEIPGLPEGTYTALVKFIGDSIFDEDEIEVIFTVSKEDSSSDANLTIDIPEGTTSPEITIEMPSDATGNLTVIIDDETYTSELVNGTATVKVPELVPGTYDDVVVAYTGDDKYSPMFNTTSIVVPKLDAGLKATSNDISLGDDAIISIEIDSRATGTVSVFIGDAVIPVTLDNGKADVSVPGLGLGNHTAVVKFEGDILFNASEVDVNISVSKDEIPENSTEPSMDIPDETTAPEFTINLPEDATGNFTVTVDGENYTAEVVNGTATVKVPDLTVGNHTISTAYSGDGKYDGYTTPAKPVDIPKAKISGGDSALDPKTPAGSSSPSYSINLPSDATGNLTVTVDGVNHTQALVNGSATVILHNLTEGNHNITVAYTGDAKYSNISKTSVYNVKVPVVKITNNKDVTMLYSAKTPYKVLVTVDGKAVGAGETVSMTFNGVTYKVQTDKNGYATLKLPDVKPKNAKYTITAEYKGVKVSNKVKVNSIVKAKNVKVKKSKKVNKIKVTLKKVNGKFLKGKKITLKIKGKKITAKTNKKGVATFKVKKNVLKKLKVGKKYKYTVTYGKDVVTKKLTVKK